MNTNFLKFIHTNNQSTSAMSEDLILPISDFEEINLLKSTTIYNQILKRKPTLIQNLKNNTFPVPTIRRSSQKSESSTLSTLDISSESETINFTENYNHKLTYLVC